MPAQQLVKPIVAGRESFTLRLVGGFGEGLGGADHVLLGGEELVEGGLGLVEQAAARGEVRLLPQQRHGNSLAAIFDKQSANQLAELVAWARQATASPTVPVRLAPATITRWRKHSPSSPKLSTC